MEWGKLDPLLIAPQASVYFSVYVLPFTSIPGIRSPGIPPQSWTWNGWEQTSVPSASLVGDGKAVAFSTSYLPFWRRAWQPTPVFLAWKSYGRGSWWATVQSISRSQTWLNDCACKLTCHLYGRPQLFFWVFIWLKLRSCSLLAYCYSWNMGWNNILGKSLATNDR